MSAFDALIDALENSRAKTQAQARLAKAVRDSQDLGAKFAKRVAGLTKSLASASNKLKRDKEKLQNERADTLLKSAEAMLASGKLNAYRTDLLKQKVAELKRKQKAKK